MELTHFVSIEIFGLKTASSESETVEVGGIILFECTDEGLHIEFGISLVVAKIGEADFDFIAKFGGLFFGFGDTSFVAFGQLGGLVAIGSPSGRPEEGTKNLNNPSPINARTATAAKELASRLDFANPFVGGGFAPVIGDWAGKNLNPKFFGIIWVEFGQSTSDTSERVNLKVFEGFDWEGLVLCQGEFGRISDRIFGTIINVIIGHLVDLHGGVLGINLALNEVLEDFGHPDIEADLPASRDDFETEVFLDATRILEFGFVA